MKYEVDMERRYAGIVYFETIKGNKKIMIRK